MKIYGIVLCMIVLPSVAVALERETFDEEVFSRRFGSTEAPQEPEISTTEASSDVEPEQVEFVNPQTPPRQNTRCSELMCGIKCRVNGCPLSECTDIGRCRCYCPRSVDPVQAFFSSILTSHMEPGLRVHFGPSLFRPPMSPPSMPDMPELVDPTTGVQDAAETPFVVHTKIYSTVSQTCSNTEDCVEACRNCHSTECSSDGFCVCSNCNRSQVDIESRRSNVIQTCLRARQCAQHCQGCSSVMCRYGVCECNMCKKSEEVPVEMTTIATEAPTTVEATTLVSEAPTTETVRTTSEEGALSEVTTEEVQSETTTQGDQVSKESVEEPEGSEVLLVKNNATTSEEHATGKRECVPKRCNHSCWERQCRKFQCVGDRCECDQCPQQVVVLSNDGKKDTAEEDHMEKNRYEIVF